MFGLVCTCLKCIRISEKCHFAIITSEAIQQSTGLAEMEFFKVSHVTVFSFKKKKNIIGILKIEITYTGFGFFMLIHCWKKRKK